MSVIAKKLNITAGSLTTSMNSLVNKKYAVRERSEQDRRVVHIRLDQKGRAGILSPSGIPPEDDRGSDQLSRGRGTAGAFKDTG